MLSDPDWRLNESRRLIEQSRELIRRGRGVVTASRAIIADAKRTLALAYAREKARQGSALNTDPSAAIHRKTSPAVGDQLN